VLPGGLVAAATPAAAGPAASLITAAMTVVIVAGLFNLTAATMSQRQVPVGS
jgi:hypothetical protein